jgi:hypothetical protein
MTQRPPSDAADRPRAVRAAEAHTAASADLEEFLRRVPAVSDPADVAEYAALLGREEAIRAERDDAVSAIGLEAPSIEPE